MTSADEFSMDEVLALQGADYLLFSYGFVSGNENEKHEIYLPRKEVSKHLFQQFERKDQRCVCSKMLTVKLLLLFLYRQFSFYFLHFKLVGTVNLYVFFDFAELSLILSLSLSLSFSLYLSLSLSLSLSLPPSPSLSLTSYKSFSLSHSL